MMPALTLVTVLWLVLPSVHAGAGEPIDARTQFLIESLESRQTYGRRWYRAWFAVYGLGMVVSTTQAAITHNDGARTDQIVSATKSAIGMAQLHLRPVRERFGADPILAMPAQTEEERRARLEAAEKLLKGNAKRDHSRYSWLPHTVNALLNVAGGAVLLAEDEPTRAAISTGVGLLFGELAIWTQPRGAEHDRQGYLERFNGEARWSFGVTPGGIELSYRF